jgi:hypothetical protein
MNVARPVLIVTVAIAVYLAPGPARALTGNSTQSAGSLYKDRTQPTEARVRDLVARMTVTEKFWQLFMLPGDLDDPGHDYSNGAFGLQIRTRSGTAAAHAMPAAAARCALSVRTGCGETSD